MFKRFFLSTCLALLAILLAHSHNATAAGDAPNYTKQIAAAPADILSGDLALPDPATNGVRSRTAMLPIDFQQNADGTWAWQDTLQVDGSDVFSLMLFAPEGDNWELTVTTPAGQEIGLDTPQSKARIDHGTTQFGIANETYASQVYRFSKAKAGTWNVTISADAVSNLTADAPEGYLLMGTKSDYQLYAHLSSYNLHAGQELGMVAYAYQDSEGATGMPMALNGVIENAGITLTTPDGKQQAITLFDDGQHGDQLANDGVFGGTFIAETSGQYIAQVSADGLTPKGEGFMRTSEHVFPVIDNDLSLMRDSVVGTAIDDSRLQLNLAVNGTLNGDVQAFAEVWGTTAKGEMAPVAWIGGVMTPELMRGGWHLPLSLDGRWISLAEVTAPFELRQVRVQDLQTAIPLVEADRMDLQMDRLPESAFGRVAGISDDMLMGERPAALDNNNSDSLAGTLMLVHGYCSGSVWNANHFTNASVFQDYNQNRTHDAFAQQIDTYGDNFSSFGIVAHSQGGAAALHLYTNYWSGLDNSSGNRLIQSVGTPYQGTALAGNLAVLGDIFGAGCGTNWDLTYDGASLWLSGIPSWARSEVYYHTTSPTTKWWRWDYCHIATDLFLDDPDDGTTEKWSGQLSGGNNLGHKKGWCHTDGMRDPQQTYDTNRNSNMNANANR